MSENERRGKKPNEETVETPPPIDKTSPQDPHRKRKTPPDGEIICELGDAVGGPA
jgi:hypothetical protein